MMTMVVRTLSYQRRGMAAAAASSAMLLATTRATCDRPPSRFGASVRNKTTSGSSILGDAAIASSGDRDDCPVCCKYSRGPCGEMFQKWLACTDEHNEGKEHVTKCIDFAKPLAACLDKHAAYYDDVDMYAADEDDEADLAQAWLDVIQSVETSHPPSSVKPFPKRPILEIRSETNTGMAGFHYEFASDNKRIVLAFIRDDASGELLAAGSMEDLLPFQDDRGVLRLFLNNSNIETVTAYALYSNKNNDDDANDVLYKYTVRIPR